MSPTRAARSIRPSSSPAVRYGGLWLVLILLAGAAVVQTALAAGENRQRWESIGRAAPRALAVAAAQAVIGVGAALCVHRLLPSVGPWLALLAVAAASYAAAVRWPWVTRADPGRLWTWIPFLALLALAAVDAIPTCLREAAAVDRAGYWFTLRAITLPLVTPLVLAGVAFCAIESFRPHELRRFLAAHLALVAGITGGALLARWRR